ncbi:hypothetical protein [Streptomyces sp. NPDC020983]|uniref:hypothetical protein n=1 Tax=Streptomyces sp. NPDC020983 TaxID=3365106 RepID=UPI0037A8AED6
MQNTGRTHQKTRTAAAGGGRSRTRDRSRARKATLTRARRRAPGRSAHRRALRREAPTVVGLLLDEHDFTTMAGYRTFPFTDYGTYLRHLDAMLRSLHAQGTSIAVTLFDPDRFATHCADSRRPPDTPEARARYTAEASTTGPAVPYTRQPLRLLRAGLARAADLRVTRDRAAGLLATAGRCTDCGELFTHCAFDLAAHTLLRLLAVAGPGTHHVVASLTTQDGPPVLAAARLTTAADGSFDLDDAETTTLCTVMAAARLTTRPGGLVLRTTDARGTDTVRGWSLHHDGPHPLTEAEVFDAYCTDPGTGDVLPPEPGVRYRAGFDLPPPHPGTGP